jgi:hypothetical protein
LPGKELHCITWEHQSLRIGFAVDATILIGNLRPDYKWTYFGGMRDGAPSFDQGVIAYAFCQRPKNEWFVDFWNTRTGESSVK